MEPPKANSQFISSVSKSDIDTIKKELIAQTSMTMKGNKYVPLIRAFGVIKLNFDNAAKHIKEGDFSEEEKSKFAELTRQYYAALKALAQCQLHMAEQVRINNRTISMVNIDSEYERLKDYITLYEDTIESVALARADHQLRNIKQGEQVQLKEIIPYVKNVYEQAYHDEHNSFWRWIKIKIFRKSDRVHEIDFLNAISQHENSNEFIRLQAARLIYNKIIATERFGRESKLAKQLGEVIEKGDISFDKGGKDNLITFLYDNDLDDKTPDNLLEYLEKNEAKYALRPDEYSVNSYQ